MNENQAVRHLVMCRLPAGTSSEQIAGFIDQFRALKDKIPGILAFECGANNSVEGLDRGLTHAFLLTFENAQARDLYLPHPAHRQFVADQGKLMAEVLVFDYTPQA